MVAQAESGVSMKRASKVWAGAVGAALLGGGAIAVEDSRFLVDNTADLAALCGAERRSGLGEISHDRSPHSHGKVWFAQVIRPVSASISPAPGVSAAHAENPAMIASRDGASGGAGRQ
jgi:hypothetical protein